MNTKTKNAKGLQGTTAQKGTTIKTENRPNITGKEAKEAKKDEPANDQKPDETPQVEAAPTAEAKAGNSATLDNQPAHIAEQPKA